MKLYQKVCVACRGGIPPLKGKELQKFAKQVKGWKIVKQHQIEKEYSFKDFVSALKFVNKIGTIAEQQGHHPDIILKWGYVKVILYTHKINGLHENDFIMAAKIDRSFHIR